ncbi:hypothetical protein CYMTET_56663 [Cymbomonas tetramitiformis]|uniref:Reverse transcriptase Ty1/copia-type domain-containing protein n=1 Tax=Cymbomonas tetramitiformis TaxID=36881 RepID=A0AAE0EM33_9CHLO|nr:hypothetical protein CYMTET_56663 [Cymbomonas tetramitiformis]
MATSRTVLNDLSYFIPGTFDPEKDILFTAMADEVTTSRGAGMASIKLYNFVTQQIDMLCVEAQYVPDSPFNLLSAVCLEDRYNLYGQLMSRDGQSRYKLEREGVLFILPEAAEAPREAAFPTVVAKVTRDIINWKFTDFQRWNEEKGPFDIDLCADEHNAQLEEYYSEKDSFFDHCLVVRAFYANMPFVNSFISQPQSKILTDFRKDLEHTKFLLVLPYKSSSPWWALTAKFDELHIYSKGSVIFSAPTDQYYRVEELTDSEPGRVWIMSTPWPVVLFYVDHFTVGRDDAKLLLHLRLGHICDNYIATMDMQGLDLGVSSEELRDSELARCSEQCMPCQVAKPTRPSQTMDRGRVPKNVRKSVKTGKNRAILGEDLTVQELVYDLHVLILLLRDCGHAGRAVDVPEKAVCFSVQHVVLAATKQRQWLSPGVTKPKCWAKVLSADTQHWQESDKKEALIDLKRAIVPVQRLPPGVTALGMKAIYKPKIDFANVLTERQSRWVVFGNKQSHGVNYEEVYAPCTQLTTLRILITLSLIMGLLAFSMDVVTCFLNSELDIKVLFTGGIDIGASACQSGYGTYVAAALHSAGHHASGVLSGTFYALPHGGALAASAAGAAISEGHRG